MIYTNHNATSIMIRPHWTLVALEKRERESNHDDLASFQKLEDEWRKNGHIYDQKRKGDTPIKIQNSYSEILELNLKLIGCLEKGCYIFSFKFSFYVHSINPPRIKKQ